MLEICDEDTPSTAGRTESANGGFVTSLNSKWINWLRLHLFEAFNKSINWDEINTKLRRRGFYLQNTGGFLWLRDCHSKAKTCTSVNLGFPRYVLERKFGALTN